MAIVINQQPISVSDLLYIEQETLHIDRLRIDELVNQPPAPTPKVKKTRKQSIANIEGLEIGSPEWRSQTARNAANKRHDQPGGSRDKQQQIRDIWATGKYSSRDICAEEECAALGMSFSAARKALRNTPEPKPIT